MGLVLYLGLQERGYLKESIKGRRRLDVSIGNKTEEGITLHRTRTFNIFTLMCYTRGNTDRRKQIATWTYYVGNRQVTKINNVFSIKVSPDTWGIPDTLKSPL